MKNSVQGTFSESGNEASFNEGEDEYANDRYDEVLQQQMEIEEHISSSSTVPCSPVSRPRAIFATSKRSLLFFSHKLITINYKFLG